MPATVLQLNISPGGVPKHPVPEALLTPLGLEGDACAHPHIHGGPNQAVLILAREVVDDLIARGYPLYYGALGENITTSGLDRRTLRVGQRYRVGSEAIIELTKKRTPCSTLDVYGMALQREIWDKLCKADDPSSPRWGMSGFYGRVVQTGRIAPGAPILLLDAAV